MGKIFLLEEKNKDFHWLKKKNPEDLPNGPGVKNPLCNAGDVDSIPGWGAKVAYAAEQLSLVPATKT